MSEPPSAPEPHELERLRAAFAAIPAQPDASSPVAPEQIWAAARGELDAQQTAAIVDQLHRDPALALEWRLAVELAAAQPERAAEASSAEEPRPPALGSEPAANDRRYWYASVLGIAAAAALGLFVLRPAQAPSDPREPGDAGAVMRGASDEAALSTDLPDGVALPRERFELYWSAVAGVDHYELRLTTAALDPVHQVLELRTPRATIPAAALAPREAGEELLWQVTAVMPDGRRLGSPAWRVVVQ